MFKRMRIISFNIWFHRYKLEERINSLVQQILTQHPVPDVLAFQEVTTESMIILQRLLKKVFPFYTPEQVHSYGVAIFSRHRIIHHLEIPFSSRMGRELLITILQYNEQRILVATAHFESEFGVNNAVKLEQYKTAQGFLDCFSSEYSNIILAADTNILSHEEDDFFSSNDWNDCWRMVDSPPDKQFTFDSKTNAYHRIRKKTYQARLDRILVKGCGVTTSFELLKKVPGKILPSDHFGVMVDINTGGKEKEKGEEKGITNETDKKERTEEVVVSID